MASMTRNEILKRAERSRAVERTDLTGVDLAAQTLDGISFRQSDLEGANLEGASLRKAVFKNASLREAYLVGANLSEANLENADLEGARLGKAVLVGANLTRTNLEGADLEGAKLAGARLTHAQLESAKLGGADLTGTNLSYATLDDAYLGGARLVSADLTGASLKGANLEEADLGQAIFDDARLIQASARGAKLRGASLVKSNLTQASFLAADLSEADIRHAILSGGQLRGARLTGARIGGMVGTGTAVGEVEAAWLDVSLAGDGSQKVSNGEIAQLLSQGFSMARGSDSRSRYFGPRDFIRNATLEFAEDARVQIESRLEGCSIKIGNQTDLVIGEAGVLDDCRIAGQGRIVIHGKFFERQSPGIIEPRELIVSARGAVLAVIQQADEPTKFSFERGCRLRMKILRPKATAQDGR